MKYLPYQKSSCFHCNLRQQLGEMQYVPETKARPETSKWGTCAYQALDAEPDAAVRSSGSTNS